MVCAAPEKVAGISPEGGSKYLLRIPVFGRNLNPDDAAKAHQRPLRFFLQNPEPAKRR